MSLRKLKKIELIGFKSFADKTTVDFRSGITAIVGPNGCGKSNIADAFRWVLGEQSAKSMRGNKMNDVIFTGTDKRKPLNFAEVSITFGNEDGFFPVDFTELCVTRRLYRNGDSEYFINRRPARLKDIVNLLMGTGIGRDSFAIFEQGKIDQVIQLTPLERRGIFEEAAGITRFLQEKKIALRKLEKTEQNISRIEDICREVEKQVQLSEKQAVQARDYKEKKREMVELDQGVLFTRWEKNDSKLQSILEGQENLKEKSVDVQEALQIWQEKLNQAKHQLTGLEQVQMAKREALFKLKSDKELKSQEAQNYLKRFEEEKLREEGLKKQKEELISKRTSLREQIRQSLEQQQQLEAELKKLESLVLEQRGHTEKLEGEVSELRQKQSLSQQERLKLIQAESQTEGAVKQAKVRLDHNLERIERHKERIGKLGETISSLQEGLIQKKEALDEVSKSIEVKKKSLEELVEKLTAGRNAVQKIQTEIETLNKDLTEANARKRVLERLREEMEGFSSATKKLLNESKKQGSPLFGTMQPLYELVTVGENDQAGAVAIRSYSQTLAVKTGRERELVLAFAREKGLKDFSLVSLEDFQEGHFKRNLKMVRSVEEAFALSRDSDVWSEEGILVDRNGVLFCPSFGESNVFVRESELKALSKEVQEKGQRKEELEAKLKEEKKRNLEMQELQRQLDQEIRREEMTLVEVRFAFERGQGDIEKADQDRTTLKNELEELVNNTLSLQQTCVAADEEYNRAKEASALAQQKNAEADAELEQSLSVLKSQQKHQKNQEVEYQAVLDRVQKATYNLNISQMRDEESLKTEEKLVAEMESCRKLQNAIKLQESQSLEMMAGVDESLSELVKECEVADEATLRQKKEIERVENEGEGVRSAIQEAEQKAYQLSIDKEQYQLRCEELRNELFERYNLTIQDARDLDIKLEIDLATAEKHVRALRRNMEAMGDVNMAAIEECEEHKERHAFLTKQLQDLLSSKGDLISVISELDTESRKLFQETFDKVRENFQKNFAILFRGGEADLKFTESLDVLDAGIEITAKPPGKQMRSISLLSGGEKCLTALALLFAFFEVKSAPFCILDEIDAPLDDSNIERFVNVVQQFIDRCQFVIITHNKRTMAIADSIFGVSMQERGVSRLLSMQFDREEVVEAVESGV